VTSTGERPWTHPAVEAARALREQEREALAASLRDVIDGEVHADRPTRLLYATDASLYQMEPAAVVFPRHAEDVRRVVELCAERGIAVLPRGAGTSLAGQAVNHAVVLDCSRHMDQILEIDAGGQWARVQPGVVVASLNREAARFGLQYPIDPATANRATIGGGIGNNSCGAHSVIYGKTIDNVIGLDVVLADGTATTLEAFEGEALHDRLERRGLEGEAYRATRRIAAQHADEIETRYPKIQRRVSGYNLDAFATAEVQAGERMHLGEMVVGSEGTLAVVTEARVRLVPVPAAKGVLAAHFDSVVAAARATVVALRHAPSAVELVDRRIIEACRSNRGFAPLVEFVRGDPGALLLIEVYGATPNEVEERLTIIEGVLRTSNHGYAWVQTTDAAAQARVWRMRQAGLGLLMSVKGDTKPVAFVEDTAVAPEQLADYLERFDELVQRYGTDAGYYGHASVGCLHIRPLVNVKTAEGLRQMEAFATEVADLVLEFGGSLSGEHGDGILRGVFTERMFGTELTSAFRELKAAWDPQGILNAGKIIETPRFGDYLRLGPETRNVEPATYLDFSADGGFARAIEQCNGQGACRKLDGGMCPSYMATHDEEHSTRGRANLLRMAISGVLPPEELTGERIASALDLCVECKACKVECPSGVDLAKLKFEVLAQRHLVHGAPLRDRVFAHLPELAATASRVQGAGRLLEVAASLPGARWALERWGGVHRARPLPRLAPRTFRAWFMEHTRTRTALRFEAPRGEVVLFDDTFTRHFHPEVGRAATAVLEALGYRVVLAPDFGCCGRPLISKGFLDEAGRRAAQTVRALAPFVERGVPIIGTEPSCLLTLRDEYPDLLRDAELHASALRVGDGALLLDELVAQLAASDRSVASIFRSDAQLEVLLHGHCHQKAGAGIEPTVAALSLVPGYDVETVDSGCCGMAGSFGFEAEHYDVSRSMGALSLFPAVEEHTPNGAVAITGVSCRQQIGHFTDRAPKHSAELLAEALR